jgi:hypothetical protein
MTLNPTTAALVQTGDVHRPSMQKIETALAAFVDAHAR